jgi:iron complex outermembrane receptor protein
MDVAREDATTWSISARGFANQAADKMLVLIDGRRVYDPLIAGVFWDAQDVPLYDIAQIEVIRGPGSSLWGADAVNGVINIITKHARETQGLLVSVGGGNTDGGEASVQYGAKLGPRAYFRIFGKYNRESLLTPDQDVHSPEPDIGTGRGGFRVDSELTNQDSLTVEGDFYSGTIGRYLLQTDQLTNNRDGGDLLARWVHRLSNGGETTLQVFWDNTNRSFGDSSWLRNTFDLDFEHQFTAAQYHNIIWGIRADYSYDRSVNSAQEGLLPARVGFKTFDGFIQDEIPLAGNLFQLIAGSKFEHNDYTGFEWQPNLRLAWTPNELQTIWMGVSRGVVVPSRRDRSAYVNLPPTVLSPGSLPASLDSTPNPTFGSQDLLAYEAGYRTTLRPSLSLDFVGFYNVYNHLLTEEAGTPYLSTSPELSIVIPYQVGNMMKGHTYGAELSTTWKATERWKLTGSYSWLKMQMQLLSGSTDTYSINSADRSPQHQLQFHSYLDLPHRFELDGALYFTSALPGWNVTPYTRCDIRAGWRWEDHTDFSLVGQNLLSGRHLEALSDGELPATSIHRSVYGRIEWRF